MIRTGAKSGVCLFLQTRISSFPTGISDHSWPKPPRTLSVTIYNVRRYRSITKQFFRKADGVVLMYDITSEYSFSDVRYWLSCIQVGEAGKSPSVLGTFLKLKASAEERKTLQVVLITL